MGTFGDWFRSKKKQQRSARLSQRVAIELRVLLRPGNDGDAHSVLLEDLSVGGACVSTPLRLAQGRRYTLIIGQEGEESIAAPCRISSIRKRQGELHVDYGLAFEGLGSAGREKLLRLVDKFQALRASNAAFSAARGR